ncbi:MAG: helix-turn-helix domain-containing protein, partial [Erysipelotrichaceae bacterium]|nr:helix-turn-helix domain-containing protein [Erysipelotrichaceae bacterium]
MKKIGLLLKQRREELGLSIEEVSHRTRLTIKYIKAIEEGDISYFKDDLSYLRFFLRSYCETIDLDFCELKDLLNES